MILILKSSSFIILGISPNEEHVARSLYEKHLSREKWENFATINEACAHLNDCDKIRSIYPHQRGDKYLKTRFKESKENKLEYVKKVRQKGLITATGLHITAN